MNEFSHRPTLRIALAAVLLVAVLVAAQGLASASAPPGGVAATGRIIGQTSFAYLGGLRTFAAAVLWNRLDPQFDQYYSSSFDQNFAVFLPTIRIVIALDPQFEQAYYVAAFWLQRKGRTQQGVDLAKEGLAKNPTSGLLTAGLAQLLFIRDRDANRSQLLVLARRGTGPDVKWANVDDQYEGYGIFRSIFHWSGDEAAAAATRRAMLVLKGNGAAPGVSVDATSTSAPSLK